MRFDSTVWRRIDDAKSGSREALESLLASYRAPILDYLRSKGIPEHDAEDVVQEVSIEICREEFLQRADRAKGRFRTLLLRVTQYVLASDLRRRSALKRGGGKALSLEAVGDIEVPAEEEERFDELWSRSLLGGALDRLKDECAGLSVPYHRVLAMKFLEGKTTQEVADALGCKPHDVENYVYQGKDRLRRHVREVVRELTSTKEEHHEEETRLIVRYGL